MKKVYLVNMCHDEQGEAQGMFSEEGELLGTWAFNDGNWRTEYFDGFAEKMGFEVLRPNPKQQEKWEKVLVERWTNGGY